MFAVLGLLAAGGGCVQVGRVERFVLAVIESGTMQAVGARADGEVRHRRLAAVVLGANGAGLQLEFADRFCRRAEFVVVAAGEIGAADRHAFDQDLVRVLLARR